MYFFLNGGHGVWECCRFRGQSLCYLFPISSTKITDLFLYLQRKQEHILCNFACSHSVTMESYVTWTGFVAIAIFIFLKNSRHARECLKKMFLSTTWETFRSFLVPFDVFSNRWSTDNFHILYLFFSFHPVPLIPLIFLTPSFTFCWWSLSAVSTIKLLSC